MKKIISQLTIGIVFLLFGFMITSQMNMLNKQVSKTEDTQNPEILVENEQLKKQRDELKKKVDELAKKTEEFETAAAGRTDEANLMLQDLQDTRLRAGLTDVKGEGIIIYITPKANLFGTTIDSLPMSDMQLLTIVNELNAVDAEAVSINDIRLTGTSGIRSAGNNSIIVSDQRISPKERVTIKAIGDKKILQGAMEFTGSIPESLVKSCEVTIETSDSVVIKKSQNTLKFQYAKQVVE